MFSILQKLLLWFLSVLESSILSLLCVAYCPLVLGENLTKLVNITFNENVSGEDIL